MDCNGVSGEMTGTTIILPLTTIEENIDIIDNNDDEHANINNNHCQQMYKYSLHRNTNDNSKKINSNN